MKTHDAALREREYVFSDGQFEFLRALIKETTGIHLGAAKRELVYGRLTKRLRQLKLSGFEEYCGLIADNRGDELGHMVNAITTNLTSFFREGRHFEYLAERLLPALMASKAHTRRIRIWSAGCSTGEEAYSLAMVVRETLGSGAGWDVKILATDLDTTVLEKAASGMYAADRLIGVSDRRLRRWFLQGRNGRDGLLRVVPELRALITFKQLNLMNDWPMKGPFDAIFCRNVMIYFDKATQKMLAERYWELLGDEGHLFLGHSESLFKVSDRFKLLGGTIYRRLNDG